MRDCSKDTITFIDTGPVFGLDYYGAKEDCLYLNFCELCYRGRYGCVSLFFKKKEQGLHNFLHSDEEAIVA